MLSVCLGPLLGSILFAPEHNHLGYVCDDGTNVRERRSRLFLNIVAAASESAKAGWTDRANCGDAAQSVDVRDVENDGVVLRPQCIICVLRISLTVALHEH